MLDIIDEMDFHSSADLFQLSLIYEKLLKDMGTDISSYITGSAQPKMSQKKMNVIKFVIPPLKIQQKTVTYLDQLSQKTEKLKQAQQEKMQSLKDLKASLLDRAFRGEL